MNSNNDPIKMMFRDWKRLPRAFRAVVEGRPQVLLTRSQFDEAIERQIDSVTQTISRLLQDAGIAAGQIDTVFFTGGASAVPLLRERVAALLPQAAKVEGDRYGSIGSGLALDAMRRFG